VEHAARGSSCRTRAADCDRHIDGAVGNRNVRFDPIGLVLLAAGLTSALYGAAEGAVVGWTSVAAWRFLGTGGLVDSGHILWSFGRAHPRVYLRLLRQRQTALAVGLSSWRQW